MSKAKKQKDTKASNGNQVWGTVVAAPLRLDRGLEHTGFMVTDADRVPIAYIHQPDVEASQGDIRNVLSLARQIAVDPGRLDQRLGAVDLRRRPYPSWVKDLALLPLLPMENPDKLKMDEGAEPLAPATAEGYADSQLQNLGADGSAGPLGERLTAFYLTIERINGAIDGIKQQEQVDGTVADELRFIARRMSSLAGELLLDHLVQIDVDRQDDHQRPARATLANDRTNR